jgi:Ras-related protein Rab-15
MSKRYDLLLRLLLVGETGVGKTCLLCRYTNNDFINAHISTIVSCFASKDVNKCINIELFMHNMQ